MMPGHVASLVVRAVPEQLPSIIGRVERLPGVEVHARSPEGKAVVVVEAEDTQQVMAVIETIEGYAGVLGCALVYHEEIAEEPQDSDHETDPT